MNLSSFLEYIRFNIFNKLFLLYIIFVSNTALSQTVWTPQNSETSIDLYSVSFTGDIFVTVGDSGLILTSLDGIQWSKQNSGVTKCLKSVCWSGNQLVAVGSDRCILTSNNGIDWTQRNVYSLGTLWGIIWTGDKYIAVGNYILNSPDGIIWDTASHSTSAIYFSVACNGKEYVAVGDGWIATSSDGITWQESFTEQFGLMGAITWTDSLFVVISNFDNALTSPNGENWNRYPIFYYENQLHSRPYYNTSIIWTSNLLVYVGYKIFTSPDAISWTIVKDSTYLNGVCLSKEKFVAVGNKGVILTSPQDVNIDKTPNLIKNKHNISLRLQSNRLTTILPTPLQNKFILTGIYSVTGKKVFETHLFNERGKIECNIANLSSGRYTFVVKGGGLQFMKTFCIIH